MLSAPERHRRYSLRLQGYDDSRAGAYFVTICASNRKCIFGEVVGGEMHLNQFGATVSKWRNELANWYPPLELDGFVVMPNHIHGIMFLTDSLPVASSSLSVVAGSSCPASKPSPSKRTVGQLVGYFKFQITKQINQIRDAGYLRVLQRNYREHIIRNERDRNAIAENNRNNPANWREDLDNPGNFFMRPPPKTSNEYST